MHVRNRTLHREILYKERRLILLEAKNTLFYSFSIGSKLFWNTNKTFQECTNSLFCLAFVFFCILSFCSDKKKQIKMWSKMDRRILFVFQNIKSDLSLSCSNKTLFLFSLSQTAVIAEIGDGGVFNYQRGFYCSACPATVVSFAKTEGRQ